MRDAQRPAMLALCRVYWNSERQRYCLAVVAEGNTAVFDFLAPRVYLSALTALRTTSTISGGVA